MQLYDGQVGRHGTGATGYRGDGQSVGCTFGIADRKHRVLCRGRHDGCADDLAGSRCPAHYGIGKVGAVQGQDQLSRFGHADLEQHKIGANCRQVKAAVIHPGDPRGSDPIIGEADILTGCHGSGIIRGHQGIKIAVAQHTPGDPLGTGWAGFTYGTLRTGRPLGALGTYGAGGAGEALRTGGAGLADGTLRACGAGFPDGTLGTCGPLDPCRALDTGRAGLTDRALGTGRAGGAGGTLGAYRPGFPPGPLRAHRSGNTGWALRTGWPCDPRRALGTHRTSFPHRTLGTYRSGDPGRALGAGRACDPRRALGTNGTGFSHGALGAHRSGCAFRTLGTDGATGPGDPLRAGGSSWAGRALGSLGTGRSGGNGITAIVSFRVDIALGLPGIALAGVGIKCLTASFVHTVVSAHKTPPYDGFRTILCLHDKG